MMDLVYDGEPACRDQPVEEPLGVRGRGDTVDHNGAAQRERVV